MISFAGCSGQKIIQSDFYHFFTLIPLLQGWGASAINPIFKNLFQIKSLGMPQFAFVA